MVELELSIQSDEGKLIQTKYENENIFCFCIIHHITLFILYNDDIVIHNILLHHIYQDIYIISI